MGTANRRVCSEVARGGSSSGMAKTSTCCLTFSLIAVALSFGGLLYLFTSSILPDIRAYLDPPDPPASATVAAVPSQFKLSIQPPVEEQFPVSSADPTDASEKIPWIDKHFGQGISEFLGLHNKKDSKADQTSKSEFDKEKAEFRALVDQREREFHEQETDLAARQAAVEQREQNQDQHQMRFDRLFAKEHLIRESHSLGDEQQAAQSLEHQLDGTSLAVQTEAKLVREQAGAVTDEHAAIWDENAWVQQRADQLDLAITAEERALRDLTHAVSGDAGDKMKALSAAASDLTNAKSTLELMRPETREQMNSGVDKAAEAEKEAERHATAAADKVEQKLKQAEVASKVVADHREHSKQVFDFDDQAKYFLPVYGPKILAEPGSKPDSKMLAEPVRLAQIP